LIKIELDVGALSWTQA